MAERLAFNTGGFGTAGGAVDSLSTAARRVPRTVSEAAPFQPPIDVANWGFWGVFGFTALLFFRPQDTIPALAPLHLPEVVAIAALIAMVADRLGRRLPVLRLSRETIGVGLWRW